MAKGETRDVTLRLPLPMWGALASAADDRGVSVKTLIWEGIQEAAKPPAVEEPVSLVKQLFPEFASIPPRPSEARRRDARRQLEAKKKALVIDAASRGMITTDIIRAYPTLEWTRQKINKVRKDAGYPASDVNATL